MRETDRRKCDELTNDGVENLAAQVFHRQLVGTKESLDRCFERLLRVRLFLKPFCVLDYIHSNLFDAHQHDEPSQSKKATSVQAIE
jgi:Zn-dependent oligopeptidase